MAADFPQSTAPSFNIIWVERDLVVVPRYPTHTPVSMHAHSIIHTHFTLLAGSKRSQITGSCSSVVCAIAFKPWISPWLLTIFLLFLCSDPSSGEMAACLLTRAVCHQAHGAQSIIALCCHKSPSVQTGTVIQQSHLE